MARIAQEAVEVRRAHVLAEVAKRGGKVTKEEWKQIGAQFGYDARGLGGFFVGEASIQEQSGAYRLTPRGWSLGYDAIRKARPKSANPWKNFPPPIVINRGKLMSDIVSEMRQEDDERFS